MSTVTININGMDYNLKGRESEEYLVEIAKYVNEKVKDIMANNRKLSSTAGATLVALNIADDYFKAAEQARESQKQRDDMEKESYSLKHDLVTMQMKLENLERKLQEAEQKQKQAEEELLKIKAVQTASAASAHGNNQNFFSGNNGHR